MKTVSLCVLAFVSAIVFSFAANAQGLMYAGVWPNDVLILDETTGAIQGKIPLKNGVAFSLTRSQDRKQFYAVTGVMETLEVVDLATKQVTDSISFSEGNKKTRFTRSVAVHPNGSLVVAPIRTTVKEIDRYTIEKPQVALIDVPSKKIVKTLEMPKEYGQGGLMRFSPDGKILYVFSRDILIVDVDSFKITDKIEMGRPLEPGLGILRFGTSFESFDQPNSLTFVYNSNDPMTNRVMQGIANFDLLSRAIDFYEVGPSIGGAFSVSPDGKRAYSLRNQIGLSEFFVWDLENKKMLRRQEYAGRPRTALKVSSDGKRVYLHQAGNTIDYYDAATLTFQKRIELPGDFTTDLFVYPR